MKKLSLYILSIWLLTPKMASAALGAETYDVPNAKSFTVVSIANTILGIVWPIVVFIVVILFIIAGFIFLTAQGDPSKIAKARLAVIWGIVGIAIIILAYSIITIVQRQLGAGGGGGGGGLLVYSATNNVPGGILTVPQCGTATVDVTFNYTSGSAHPVGISAFGLPSGTTVTGVAPPQCTPTCTLSVEISVGCGTASGSYPITIQGQGGYGTNFTLNIP